MILQVLNSASDLRLVTTQMRQKYSVCKVCVCDTVKFHLGIGPFSRASHYVYANTPESLNLKHFWAQVWGKSTPSLDEGQE